MDAETIEMLRDLIHSLGLKEGDAILDQYLAETKNGTDMSWMERLSPARVCALIVEEVIQQSYIMDLPEGDDDQPAAEHEDEDEEIGGLNRAERRSSIMVRILCEFLATIGRKGDIRNHRLLKLNQSPIEPTDRMRTLLGMDNLPPDQFGAHIVKERERITHHLLSVISVASDEFEDQTFAADNEIDPVAFKAVKNLSAKSGRQRHFTITDSRKVTFSSGTTTPTATSTPAQTTAPLPAPVRVDEDTLIAPWRERVTQLETESATLRRRLDHFENREDDTQTAQYRSVVRSLRARIHALEVQARAKAKEAPVTPESPPATWDRVGPYVDAQFGGRLFLTKRALKAATQSGYTDVPYAVRVLRMLADDYVPMRRGEEGARERFSLACQNLSVKVGPTGSAVEMARFRPSYQIDHLDMKLDLDLHVQGNSSRNPTKGFRLYFAFVKSEDGGYVVVGHLPTHLDNTWS